VPLRFCIERLDDGTLCAAIHDGKTQRCPPHQAAATKRRNTDAPGRPSAAQRGYGAEWRRVSAQVIAQTKTCHWCGGPPAADDPFTADHIVPLARGGTNDRSNLIGAHRSCNSRRGGQMRRKRH
jgi:5-methylcytosine-specific restriction enzyme A